KTGRAVVVQEAQRQAGVGATVASELAERAILSLEAPIARVAAADTVYPFIKVENVWLQNKNDIIEKEKATLEYKFINKKVWDICNNVIPTSFVFIKRKHEIVNNKFNSHFIICD